MFAGDRRDELRRRLAGESYASIAASGGGIVSTVEATRRASEQALVDGARARLDEMLACGTTTCEIKSGYGLDLASELKILRAIRTLGASHAVDVVATFTRVPVGCTLAPGPCAFAGFALARASSAAATPPPRVK